MENVQWPMRHRGEEPVRQSFRNRAARLARQLLQMPFGGTVALMGRLSRWTN